MSNFKYAGRRRDGSKVEGVQEANDRRMAMQILERQGIVPLTITEVNESKRKAKKTAADKKKKGHFSLGFQRRPRMSMNETLLFTGELSDLLSSGMKLGNALHAFARRETGKPQDQIMMDVRDQILQGTSLSDALKRWPESFSKLYISMVQAGEASGSLAETLEQLRSHLERVMEAREKVVTAMIYPAIILFMGGGTLVFAMVFVIPRFTAMFEELGSTLPLPTRILISFSDFMGGLGGIITLCILVSAFWMFKQTIKTQKGRRAWHRFQLRMPLIKHIVAANAYAHFARTLGALLSNGVDILKALTIVENTISNAYIAEAIHKAHERVTDGATISGPLAASKVFPGLLIDMLAVGEQTGDIGGALGHIAKRYDSELDRNIKVLTTMLEPILMVGMAVIVGFVAISMLMAVFDLTSGLNV